MTRKRRGAIRVASSRHPATIPENAKADLSRRDRNSRCKSGYAAPHDPMAAKRSRWKPLNPSHDSHTRYAGDIRSLQVRCHPFDLQAHNVLTEYAGGARSGWLRRRVRGHAGGWWVGEVGTGRVASPVKSSMKPMGFCFNYNKEKTNHEQRLMRKCDR